MCYGGIGYFVLWGGLIIVDVNSVVVVLVLLMLLVWFVCLICGVVLVCFWVYLIAGLTVWCYFGVWLHVFGCEVVLLGCWSCCLIVFLLLVSGL